MALLCLDITLVLRYLWNIVQSPGESGSISHIHSLHILPHLPYLYLFYPICPPLKLFIFCDKLLYSFINWVSLLLDLINTHSFSKTLFKCLSLPMRNFPQSELVSPTLWLSQQCVIISIITQSIAISCFLLYWSNRTVTQNRTLYPVIVQ